MPVTSVNLTLSRFYEILKDAAKYSKTNDKCSEINTFAVCYEFADFNKDSFGMKPEDSNTPSFWTRASMSLNEITIAYPTLVVFDFAGQYVDQFNQTCQAHKIHEIRLVVSDVFVQDSSGLSIDCNGRNITAIFSDTEKILDNILKYISSVSLFAVTNLDSSVTVSWDNKNKLQWMKLNGLIADYGDSSAYPELAGHTYFYYEKINFLNQNKRFQRIRGLSKDNVAGTYVDISVPCFNAGDFNPNFYTDTNKINAKDR